MNPLSLRPFTTAALACALFGLTLAVGAAFAQVPGLPSLEAGEKTSAQDAKPTAAESAEQATKRIREHLAELRREPSPAPDGVTPAEVEAARQSRASLRYVLERQLRVYEELGSARELRLIAEERERGWTGFEQAPPYPIQMVDDLRDAAGIVRSRIATLEAGGVHLDAEQSRYQDAARRAEAAQRAANEALASEKDAPDKAVAAWRRDAAVLEARRAAGWPVLGRLLRELHGEEIGTRRAELRLLERQIAMAASRVRFTEEDVAEARQRAADDVAGLRKKLAAATSAADSLQRERETASRELGRLKEAGQARPEAIALAEARLHAADAWLNAKRSEMEAVRGEMTLAEEFTRLWAHRLTASTSSDADARRESADHLAQAATLFGHWLSYVQNQLTESRMALRDAEAQLTRATDTKAATIEFDRQAVAAASHSAATTERVRNELARLTSMLNRWVVELKAGSAQRSLATRALDAWSATRQIVRDVWNFELFAVEDTAVLDGRTVTTSHGVTVGKSVGALLLFVGGYALAALLTRRLARWLVGRGADERIVRTLRRWFLAVNALVLALFTLNIAKIPLTVFAFLGGTLAIAVGFGAQTFVKNLISGMILLVERSVQIGDIVEVEGISGTVTAVDLRSSTVRGFDGTETIVPNSQLLENKFTNWTHTDRRLRRILKVGVAYGSPVRQVAEILEECAKRHGLVLDEPAPRAIFEDFGDSALVFGLHVWIDFRPEVSAPIVLSDLRFMIERQFREAGIVMAFPQRDVHLDSAGPLRVELVRAAGEGTPPG